MWRHRSVPTKSRRDSGSLAARETCAGAATEVLLQQATRRAAATETGITRAILCLTRTRLHAYSSLSILLRSIPLELPAQALGLSAHHRHDRTLQHGGMKRSSPLRGPACAFRGVRRQAATASAAPSTIARLMRHTSRDRFRRADYGAVSGDWSTRRPRARARDHPRGIPPVAGSAGSTASAPAYACLRLRLAPARPT